MKTRTIVKILSLLLVLTMLLSLCACGAEEAATPATEPQSVPVTEAPRRSVQPAMPPRHIPVESAFPRRKAAGNTP